MFSKILTSSALVLALALQVHAHAAVSPALGVSGTPVRADVQRPSDAEPCGTIDIASALDSSTAVTASADGTVDATALDFNAGTDGSREFTAKVDPTGTGKSFVAMTITTNGLEDPTTVGSQPLVASLPAGTKCTGGTAKNKCLLQFVSTAGFGNCVAVTQGASTAAATADTTTTAGAADDTAAASTAAGTTVGAKAKGGKKAEKGKKAKKAQRAGTTAARALIYDLKDRVDKGVDVVKRSVSWIWA